jgi:20S proteasome subunit alpha 7
VKDKEFELELSWVCDESNRRHERVPADVLTAAIEAGRQNIQAEHFDSDEEMAL